MAILSLFSVVGLMRTLSQRLLLSPVLNMLHYLASVTMMNNPRAHTTTMSVSSVAHQVSSVIAIM